MCASPRGCTDLQRGRTLSGKPYPVGGRTTIDALPMMLPILIVTALLRLIDAFKVLEVILVMTEGGPGLSTEILALRISRTATEFRELGVAAAMSNYLLMLLMILTVSMFAFTRWQERRANRLAAAIQEDE